MSMSDPVADMLTRIRNAVATNKSTVQMPSSKLKLSIAEVLKREGYISDFEIVEKPIQNDVKLSLKYGVEGEKVIQKIIRFSTPGCRKFRAVSDIPTVMNGLGIAVVSTNKGVLSDRECRRDNVGGEVLFTVC